MRRAASKPDILGIVTLMTITSGLRDSARLTACSPSRASPTTSKPRCAFKMLLTISSIVGWSSATRIRIAGFVRFFKTATEAFAAGILRRPSCPMGLDARVMLMSWPKESSSSAPTPAPIETASTKQDHQHDDNQNRFCTHYEVLLMGRLSYKDGKDRGRLDGKAPQAPVS